MKSGGPCVLGHWVTAGAAPIICLFPPLRYNTRQRVWFMSPIHFFRKWAGAEIWQS